LLLGNWQCVTVASLNLTVIVVFMFVWLSQLSMCGLPGLVA